MPSTVPITAFSRYEHIDSITFSENTTQTLPTNGGLLPNDRFMSFLILEFRGRLTMPAATGPSAAQGDSIAAIINRVIVEGYHKVRRQQEKFIDLRGADLELMQRVYCPGTFIKTPTSISVSANATNDVIFQLLVPFTPLRMPVAVQAGYLLDCPNYESLKLTVQWGDYKSVVVPGSTAATWSAYGATTGSPTLRVAGGFAIQTARFATFLPGRVWRYFSESTGSVPTTTNTQSRLFDIPKGYDIRGIFMKTGTKATNTTAGNDSYATLSDWASDIRINMGLGRAIRRYLDGNGVYADLCTSYNVGSRITGVNPIDFAQYGAPGEVLATRPLISGPTGNVDLYLSAGMAAAAARAGVGVIEERSKRPL